MFTDEMINRVPLTPLQVPDASWLAGAAAGLEIVRTRSPKWMWEDFLNDIRDMIGVFEDITPSPPGTYPTTGDGAIGSAYDSLGGYVSIVGELCPEGLYFRVHPDHEVNVARLLSGIALHGSNGELLVSMYDLPAFTRLVPIHGPLADTIEEDEML